MVLRLVNSSERKKPPTISTPTIQANGTPGVKVAQAATNAALMSAFTVSTQLKPKRRRMIGTTVFMPIAPTTLESVIRPDWNGGETEAELQQERQQERHRADAGAVDEAAEDRGAHGRDLQQREIEHRRRRAPGMQDIGIGGDGAAGDQRQHDRQRQEIEAEHRAAEGEPADAEPGQHHADRVERVGRLRAHVLDEDRRQHDAGEPDRDVDQEDPVPGNVGGDEAAERRARAAARSAPAASPRPWR